MYYFVMRGRCLIILVSHFIFTSFTKITQNLVYLFDAMFWQPTQVTSKLIPLERNTVSLLKQDGTLKLSVIGPHTEFLAAIAPLSTALEKAYGTNQSTEIWGELWEFQCDNVQRAYREKLQNL